MSELEEVRPKPTRLDDSEAKWARLIALGSFAVFVLATSPWDGQGGTFTLVGALYAALLIGATYTRNRIIVSMASMFIAFGPWGDFALLGGVAMAFSFLLAFRTSRASSAISAERAAARRAARDAERAAKAGGTEGGGAEAGPEAPRRRRAKSKDADTPAPAGPRPPPPPSKRFTPPKRATQRRGRSGGRRGARPGG